MAGSIPLMMPTNPRIMSRRQQRSGIDREMDVAFRAIFHERAPQSKRSDRPGDEVSEKHAGNSAEKRDGEGFGEKLDQDMPTASAERFFDANLARALGHGDQHDIHQTRRRRCPA